MKQKTHIYLQFRCKIKKLFILLQSKFKKVDMTKLERASFGSKLGVILATAGSAVGLGNIWRFPYMTGQNGGAIFIIIMFDAPRGFKEVLAALRALPEEDKKKLPGFIKVFFTCIYDGGSRVVKKRMDLIKDRLEEMIRRALMK